MTTIDTIITGTVGAAPMPAAVVRPSSRTAAVLMAPTAAPFQGTGPSCDATGLVVRPWELAPTGTRVRSVGTAAQQHTSDFSGNAAPTGGYAERTASSTPGAQPPRAPLS
ncbi:hypothetical protein [Modestobacter lapidis]|nr:hypothetical protein [Modestobacter lapidis]